MKYAVINQRGGINRISKTEPQHIAEGVTVVEITDEQFDQIQEGRTSEPPVRYFLIDGDLITAEAKMEAEKTARQAERIAADLAKPRSAEQWIARSLAPGAEQFIALRVSAFQDLEVKLKEADKVSPKLSAMRAWIDSIMGLYAQDQEPRNDWPQAPHGFEETIQEAAFVLSQE